MRISEPGVYDIPSDEYHADPVIEPSLSSSICKTLISWTPRHAYTEHPRLNPNFERNEDDKFNIGNAAHVLVLGDVQRFAIFSGDSWRGNAAQAHKAKARAEHKVPLLKDQLERVQAMRDACFAQLAMHEDASDAFQDGKPEQTVVWREGKIWCRLKLDFLKRNRSVFDDYKSTECANPDAWKRIAFSESVAHDIQAAFYRRGVRAAGLAEEPRMRSIVQETSDPYALCAIEFEPEDLALADRRIARAMEIWGWCIERNEWPGYPAFTVRMRAPGWHETQLMDREIEMESIARKRGLKHSTELLALGMKFHEPL